MLVFPRGLLSRASRHPDHQYVLQLPPRFSITHIFPGRYIPVVNAAILQPIVLQHARGLENFKVDNATDAPRMWKPSRPRKYHLEGSVPVELRKPFGREE